MRLELTDGQWVELCERLTYAQARDLRAAFLSAKTGKNPAAMADIPMALLRAYVTAWNVLDFDGHAVAIEDAENMPDETMVDIAAAAIDLWNEHGAGTPVPKAGTARSRSTRRALRSA